MLAQSQRRPEGKSAIHVARESAGARAGLRREAPGRRRVRARPAGRSFHVNGPFCRADRRLPSPADGARASRSSRGTRNGPGRCSRRSTPSAIRTSGCVSCRRCCSRGRGAATRRKPLSTPTSRAMRRSRSSRNRRSRRSERCAAGPTTPSSGSTEPPGPETSGPHGSGGIRSSRASPASRGPD